MTKLFPFRDLIIRKTNLLGKKVLPSSSLWSFSKRLVFLAFLSNISFSDYIKFGHELQH